MQALRSARRTYQQSALHHQELASGMARSINNALRKDGDVPLPRPQSAGIAAVGGRRKWKRDLAAELRNICGRGGVDAALHGEA